MILIADSGSTKTTWSILYDNNEVQTCNTSGINPFFMKKEEIIHLLQSEYSISKSDISSVHFYGAGCIPPKTEILREVLSDFFNTEQVDVNSDLLAAARSLCQNEPGIGCILGTGSNSCYYDGEKIVQNVPALGYILGDEGSGAVLGRKLLGNILKDQVSKQVRDDFFETYPFTPGDFIEQVYRKPFPNRYLAQFTKFIAKHLDQPEISFLVESSFNEFITRNLLQYEFVKKLPIHFTGSIAFYFKSTLKKSLEKQGLKLGAVLQAPMPGLISYHQTINF